MEAKRTYDEKLEKIKLRQKQLREEEKRLRARYNADARKARTKMLIEIGTVFESFLNREIVEEDKERLQAFLARQMENDSAFAREMHCNMTEQPENKDTVDLAVEDL